MPSNMLHYVDSDIKTCLLILGCLLSWFIVDYLMILKLHIRKAHKSVRVTVSSKNIFNTSYPVCMYSSNVDYLKMSFKFIYCIFCQLVKKYCHLKLTCVNSGSSISPCKFKWLNHDFVTEFLFVKMLHLRKVVALNQKTIMRYEMSSAFYIHLQVSVSNIPSGSFVLQKGLSSGMLCFVFWYSDALKNVRLVEFC